MAIKLLRVNHQKEIDRSVVIVTCSDTLLNVVTKYMGIRLDITSQTRLLKPLQIKFIQVILLTLLLLIVTQSCLS